MVKLLDEEQDEFLRKNVKNRSNRELTALINNHFSLSLAWAQIKAYKKNHKISSGLTGHFNKGSIPANKGRKYPGKINSTTFKKGSRPHNYQPIGTERINGDGYLDVKVADPNKWVGKHILIWEAAYGKRPKSSAIVFADQNKMNVDLENLILVDRKELLIANKKQLLKTNAEFTKTGLILVKVFAKLNERKKS